MEDLDEVRTKSDYVKESSNPDEFKEVDQDSDVEKKKKKMVDVEGGVSCSSDDHFKKAFDQDSDVEKKKMVDVEGGVSYSSDDNFKKAFDQDSDVEKKKMLGVEGSVSCSSDDHFKKVDQDSDVEKKKWKRVEEWDEERAEGLETQILTLLDDMKFMVSRTADMVGELKALGNCSSSKGVDTCRITSLLNLIDEEVGKMEATEDEEKRSGSSKVVSLLYEILQLGDKQLEVKGLLGGVETSLEELESFVKDSSEDSEMEGMKSRIANLKELNEERVKNCEQEVKEMGAIVKEVKETIQFGSEHESVVQTYFESMEEKIVDTYFESVKLKRKEWESRIRRRTDLPGVRIGHETNAD